MKKSIIFASAILAGLALFCGCQSVPENIPDDLDARQLIQLGQDNYDTNHLAAAQKYFNTVLERYGDDPKHYIEAKYELGHLFIKQKKYRSAYDTFSEILEIYESVPMGLPGAYKILCGIEMAKIPEEKLNEFKNDRDAQKQREAQIQARQNVEPIVPAAPQEEAAPQVSEPQETPEAKEAKEPQEAQEPKSEDKKEAEPPKEEGPDESAEGAKTESAPAPETQTE